jgi:hypothetical protein
MPMVHEFGCVFAQQNVMQAVFPFLFSHAIV